jgi:hypothetical protein
MGFGGGVVKKSSQRTLGRPKFSSNAMMMDGRGLVTTYRYIGILPYACREGRKGPDVQAHSAATAVVYDWS